MRSTPSTEPRSFPLRSSAPQIPHSDRRPVEQTRAVVGTTVETPRFAAAIQSSRVRSGLRWRGRIGVRAWKVYLYSGFASALRFAALGLSATPRTLRESRKRCGVGDFTLVRLSPSRSDRPAQSKRRTRRTVAGKDAQTGLFSGRVRETPVLPGLSAGPRSDAAPVCGAYRRCACLRYIRSPSEAGSVYGVTKERSRSQRGGVRGGRSPPFRVDR